jgi:acetyltransferase-like isoleucine patch superfamily enzyme
MTVAPLSRLTGLRHSPWIQQCASGLSWFRGMRHATKSDRHGQVFAGAGVRIRKRFAKIDLGEGVKLGHGVGIGAVGRDPTDLALLRIGAHTIIGDRTHINCQASIAIGTHCAISWDVEILDADMHAIVAEDGQILPNRAPVVIEDRVWIGTRALILKGVTIGHDSIVAAGSVVVSPIPPFSICAGNPAKVIRSVQGWRH